MTSIDYNYSELRDGVRKGAVVLPGEEGWDEARSCWNAAAAPVLVRRRILDIDAVVPTRKSGHQEQRAGLERELWADLRNTVGGAFSLEKVIEYLEAPELAPALFLKDVAEVGAAGVKAFEEAGRIDDQLSEPNC